MEQGRTPLQVIAVLAPNLAANIESFIDEVRSAYNLESIAIGAVSSRLKLESAELMTAVDTVLYVYEQKISDLKCEEHQLNIEYLQSPSRSSDRNLTKIKFTELAIKQQKLDNEVSAWKHVYEMLKRYDFALKSAVSDKKFVPSTTEGG